MKGLKGLSGTYKEIGLSLVVAFIVISTLALAAPLLITITYPTNASVVPQTSQVFNFTTNATSEAGRFELGWANGTLESNATMTRLNATFYGKEIKYLTWDSPYGKWHNITFYASDVGVDYSSSETLFFKVDTVNPTADRWVGVHGNWTVGNDTISGQQGNILNITFNTSDRYINSCGIRLYRYPNLYSSPLTITGNFYGTAAENRNCTAMVNASNVTIDGPFIIEYYSTDHTGNVTYGSSNETGVKMTLKSNAWTTFTYYGKNYTYTMNNLTNNFPGEVHTVAKWSNSQKNYTIYSTATPLTNNDSILVQGDTVWMYNNASYDVGYLEHAYWSDDYLTLAGTETNISLWGYTAIGGLVAATTGWNMMPTYKDKTYNETIWGYATANNLVKTAVNANFTSVCVWNATEVAYICCMPEFDYCTGGFSVLTTIPRGNAVWVNVNLNMTFDVNQY